MDHGEQPGDRVTGGGLRQRPRRARRCAVASAASTLAGIAHFARIRSAAPSGTYYKLCVPEHDAVDAYLALGAWAAAAAHRRLHEHPRAGPRPSRSRDVAGMLRDEAAIAAGGCVDACVRSRPHLLGTLRPARSLSATRDRNRVDARTDRTQVRRRWSTSTG